MTDTHNTTQTLLAKGVQMPHPASVCLADDVDPARIAAGVIIHPGCRLSGATLAIGAGSELGREAPATLRDCQIATNVSLAGGYFEGSVFLDGVSIAAAAHIRPGCLLEEQVTCGHAVGLKQTLLMSFVTTGSLINFCDCAMAGGTSRQNHSEVGSSYIHFNFSPNQDKATASMMGDVPHGVMLDQAPIFLGGQGGLVGPTRVEYGSVVAAGSILRKDVLTPGQLIAPKAPVIRRPFDAGVYPNVDRKSQNNRLYIANLCALLSWYRHVRAPFFARDPHASACGQAAETVITDMIRERLKRVTAWIKIMPPKDADALCTTWDAIHEAVSTEAYSMASEAARDTFLNAASAHQDADHYLDFVSALPADARALGTTWLQSIVDSI